MGTGTNRGPRASWPHEGLWVCGAAVGTLWGWDMAVPMPSGSPTVQMPETDVYLSGII